jgi:two-component SAPR family response regulator
MFKNIFFKSKLKIPELPKNIVNRNELLKKVNLAISKKKKLIIITASSGYGKTTFVTDYILKDNKSNFLWYSINDIDNDPIIFLTHIVKGLKEIFKDFNLDIINLILSNNIENIITTITALICEEISNFNDKNFYIVFDDYNNIKNEVISNIIESFIEYLPKKTFIFILSKNYPNIRKINFFKIKQLVEEINNNDLKFSKDEIAKFLETYKFDNEIINKIEKVTGGWIGIINFIANTYKFDNFDFSINQEKELLFSYIGQEFFDYQEKNIQEFMLKTSFLPYINKELCNNLFKKEDLSGIINKLNELNVFEKDLNNQIKYPILLKEFLINKSNEILTEDEINKIYITIADYYVKNFDLDEAIEYYIKAKEFDNAKKYILNISKEFIYKNRIDTLIKIINKIDSEYINKSLDLLILLGDLNRLIGNYNKSFEYFDMANKISKEQKNNEKLAIVNIYKSILLASRGENVNTEEIDIYINMLNKDDFENLALAYNTKAINYLFENKVILSLDFFEKALKYYEKINDNFGQAKVLHNMGFAYSKLGKFERAKEIYELSIKQIESINKYPYIMTLNNIAIIYNYIGDFKSAINYAQKSFDIAYKLGYKRDLSYVYWTLGMIYTNLENFIKAEDYFNNCLSIGLELADRQVQAYALSGLSEVARMQNKINKSYDLIEEAIRRRDLPLNDTGNIELLIQKASICIDKENYSEAKEIIENYLIDKLENFSYNYYLTHVYFFLTLIYEKTDKNLFHYFSDKTKKLIMENNYNFFLNQQKYIPYTLKDINNKKIEVINKEYTIKFYCFGEFKTLVNNKQIPNKDWNGYKTKLALIFILHNKQGVTKEKLAEILYPETDITRTAINVILTRLRKAIEPNLNKNSQSKYILFNEGKYLFNFSIPYFLDTQEFEYFYNQLKEINDEKDLLQILEKICNLYKGDFASEFSDFWVDIERENYKSKVNEALKKLGNLYLKNNKLDELLDLTQKFISIDRINEVAFELKIKALISLNKKEEALKQFNILRNILKSELDVIPSKSITELISKVR